MLLRHLPPGHDYKVVFMHRDISEILASQRKMMERRGEEPGDVSDDSMAALYRRHLSEVQDWLGKQRNVETLHINYNEALLDASSTICRVNAFLGGGLDTEVMAQVVDPDLYRRRK